MRSSRTAARRPSSGEKPGSAKAKGKFGIVDTHGWLMEGTEDGITFIHKRERHLLHPLSKYLPQYIAKNMGGYVESFLGMHNLQKSDMDFWAIHPGGRRIIEEAQNAPSGFVRGAGEVLPDGTCCRTTATCSRRP